MADKYRLFWNLRKKKYCLQLVRFLDVRTHVAAINNVHFSMHLLLRSTFYWHRPECLWRIFLADFTMWIFIIKNVSNQTISIVWNISCRSFFRHTFNERSNSYVNTFLFCLLFFVPIFDVLYSPNRLHGVGCVPFKLC